MLCTSSIIFGPHGPYLEMRRFRFAQTLVAEGPRGALPVWVAETFGQRLLGLAGLAENHPAVACRGLLIPACASVHTWGMRFAIDVAFLEWPTTGQCEVLYLCEEVAPLRRVRLPDGRAHRTAVLEAPAGALTEALGVDPAVAYPAVNFRACPQST